MRKTTARRAPRGRALDRGMRALEGMWRDLEGKTGGVHFHVHSGMKGTSSRALTSYHDLALDFELGVLARVFEEEIDVANHRENSDILVCDLDAARCGLQRTGEDDKCKFYKVQMKKGAVRHGGMTAMNIATHCLRPPANFLFTSISRWAPGLIKGRWGKVEGRSRCIAYSCSSVSSSLAVSSRSSAFCIHVWYFYHFFRWCEACTELS